MWEGVHYHADCRQLDITLIIVRSFEDRAMLSGFPFRRTHDLQTHDLQLRECLLQVVPGSSWILIVVGSSATSGSA